jgi:hypothetical protein
MTNWEPEAKKLEKKLGELLLWRRRLLVVVLEV